MNGAGSGISERTCNDGEVCSYEQRMDRAKKMAKKMQTLQVQTQLSTRSENRSIEPIWILVQDDF
eukprot:COSAG04_NODE_4407_length_2111_cov_5.308648_2_plen_65_part_00